MIRLLAIVVLLAGCASTQPDASADARPDSDLPTGTWRGTMVQDGVFQPVPTVLYVEEDRSVELVPGATRVRADDVTYEDGRLVFRAPQFPVPGGQRRALRCNLLHTSTGLRGTCRAGAASYELALRLSSSRSYTPAPQPRPL